MPFDFRRRDAPEGSRGFDWYVDSVNGNDANTGRAPTQAFATITQLETVFEANQKAGLARGSHFREQLDIPGNNCTVAAYGDAAAAKPLLDCSDVIPSSGWTKTGGSPNIYERTIALETAGGQTWVSVWVDNTRLKRATSMANCDATPGSYVVANDLATSTTLYIHAPDSTNPASDGKEYEYSKRKYGLYSVNRSNLTISNIHARRNLHNDGSFVLGRSSLITDCKVEDGTKHNILFGDGCTLRNVEARNAYYTAEASHTYFVYYEGSPAGLGVLMDGCSAISDVYDNGSVGFYGHRSISGTFGVVRGINCTSQNLTQAFDGAHADSLIWEDCHAIGCYTLTGGMSNQTFDGGDFRYLHSGGAPINPIMPNVTISINDFTFGNESSPSAGVGVIQLTNTGCHVILNNVTFEDTIRYAANAAVAGCTIEAYDCDIQHSVAAWNIASGSNYIGDNNHYSKEALYYVWQGVVKNNLTEWKAATGQDTLSTAG